MSHSVAPPRLIVFTDTEIVAEDQLVARLEALLARARAESVLVVLRDKDLPARRRLRLGERLRHVCAATSQRFGVADRLDLAVLLRADAVHLGEGSVLAADARRLVPPGTWVTRACHDPLAAAADDADAILLSPVVAPRKGRPALGVGALTEATRVLTAARPERTRVYALGGVDAGAIPACLAAGAEGVAVIGAAFAGPDPLPLLLALGVARVAT